MTDTVHVGVIGCGNIAMGKHLPALTEIPGVEVDVFCDVVAERAEAARQRFGHATSGVVADYRAILDRPLDAVYVLTPNRWHAEMTIAALRAGKHVLCEKPMAITGQDADAMVAAAEEAQRILTIGYQNRWRPEAQYLKRVAEEGALGRIYFAKALAVRRRGVPIYGVFLSEAEQGGGPLIDIGTHALDLTLWLMNNYQPKMVVGTTFRALAERSGEVNPWGVWDPQQYTVEDAAFGYIQMTDGALIWLESSWALNTLEVGEAQAVLCGTQGGADMRQGVRINGTAHGALVTQIPDLAVKHAQYTDVPLETRPGLTEAKSFLRAVRGEAVPLVEPWQAAVVTRVLEAIYTSARTGQPVWLA